MTLVLTTNALGQPRGEPVRLSNRRRRLSTVVARHRLPPGRRFVVSVHRRGETGEIYLPNDRTVRLRAAWSKTLVGPQDVVVITTTPMGKGVASIGLAIASIALIALAPAVAPALAGSLLFGGGAAAGGLTTAIQAGLVIGGVALGYAAQASKAAGKKTGPESYSISGGGNVPKPGTRKPLLYGRCWTSPPLSQPDYFTIDGDANVLTKRMTLGLGKYQIHRIRVGDALFWDEVTGIQAPFNAATGSQGAAVEFLYEQPSTIVPGDIVPSPSVGGQEVPRPGGNPERTPWYRLAPQGVSVDAAQMNWTYPAIYRISSSGKNAGAPAGVVFFGREIHPNTGAILGPEFELWRSMEPNDAYIRTPLRRNAYFRLPRSGAYEVSAQNAFPEPLAGVEIENRVVWDAMFGFEDDTRIRPQTTEIVLRMRAGKGLTVTSYSDITVEATRILPVWTGSTWVEQPTRKAVWAYCDLVRAGYGLAAPNGVEADRADYYAQLLTANDTFDGQLPEVSSFWEAASEVLQPLRADPVKVGAVHSFVRDESRAEPRHVLTRRQIIRDSGGATFRTKVEGGDVIVEFNRDGDPKRPDEARFSYGPPSRTPKRYRVNGITDGLHALKHATWLAAVAVFRGAERKITTEWDGRLVCPGDHVLSDLWFLKGKQAYGVAARAGNVLTLDVTANVPTEWGYGSIRTRAGREWGILRMRGVGARGLELHPIDVPALEAQTGLSLAAVLTRDTQDSTTVVLGELVELQETYVARSAIPSDADHVQIEMVADDARVWQLLDEQVIAPAPINGDAMAEPLVPTISVLHARCVRIETGIEVVWGVSATRGARNYEADLSYDGGATWESLSPFGPESSGRAPMRQSDGPVTVRARAYGRTGLPGDWIATTFTTVAPVVAGALVDITTLPLLGYANLDDIVTGQLDRLDGIQNQAEAASAAAANALSQSLARLKEVQQEVEDASLEASTALAATESRLNALRRGLALDPAIRQTVIDPIIGDLRADFDIIRQATERNLQEVIKLRDALSTAGLEVLPAQGLVRFYAIEKLRTETTETIKNFSITVNALSGKIDLYGSVQAGDLNGLITQITTVQTQLNALAGTITNTVTSAEFNKVEARVGTAEQILKAQAGEISERATVAVVNQQGLRINAAERSINAALGSISQSVTASSSSRIDFDQLPRTLAGFFDLIQRQQGALQQTLAFANESISANIDAAGRATAEVRTELGVFNGEATAQFTSLTRAVASTDAAQVSQQTLFSARFGAVEASITGEIKVRSDQFTATTSRIDGALSKIGAAESAITVEATTRATADSASTLQLNAAVSRLGSAEGAITSLSQTQADDRGASASQFAGVTTRFGAVEAETARVLRVSSAADLALSQSIDTLRSTVSGNTSSIATEASTRATQVDAISRLLSTVSSETDRANSRVTTEASTRAAADVASTQQLNAAVSRLGTAEGAITSLGQTQANDRGANASQFAGITTRFGTVEAEVNRVSTTMTAVNEAFSRNLTTINAKTDAANAAIASESTARASIDEALSQSITLVNAKANTANVGLSQEVTARIQGDTANGSLIQDLYARNDIGTAFGRFAMTTIAAPSGVSVRLSAQASTDSYGQRRNAGWYLDLLPDGSSRFLVDANLFAMTANGGVTYPFSFDGQTLRVPSIVLTGSNLPPGVANAPARFDAKDYTLIAGAGTNNNALDGNMVANIPVENGIFPTTISLYGKLSITGNGQLTSPILEIDGVDVGQFLFRGGATTSVGVTTGLPFTCTAVLYLGPGNHTARFRYSYSGNGNAGSSVVINEIHLAASTPRA